MARVVEITDVVHGIAAVATEQAQSLEHVNEAVDNMDQTTQQNAAMVEEATAATKQLAMQSDELDGIVAGFVTGAQRLKAVAQRGGRTAPAPAARRLAEPMPAARRMPQPPSQPMAKTGTDDGWEDF